MKKPGAGLLVVMTCAMGVGPLMSYGLSATSSLVIRDLGITESQFGLLATVSFFAAAVSSAWLGRLSDRVSGKMQLLIIFGGTAVALALAGLSRSYLWLLVAVAIAGVAQAISNPTTNRLIMHHAPLMKRAGWIGIKQSGVQGSQLFSGLFFPAAALLVGWHGAIGAAAVIAIGLMLWAWNRLPDEPAAPRTPPAAGSNEPSAAVVPADAPKATAAGTQAAPAAVVPAEAVPARHPMPGAVWLYAAYALLTGAGIQATNVYLPLFAQRGLGFSLVLAGITVAVSGIVGVTSRVYWGRRVTAGAGTLNLLLLMALGATFGALMLLLAGVLQLSALAWVGVVLHGAMALGVNVVVMSGVMREVPAARVGAASGVVALGMYFGFAMGPLAMGFLLQLSGSFFAGWLLAAVVYALAAILAVYRMVRARTVLPRAS